MAAGEAASFWDSVRSWADSAGLLLPTASSEPSERSGHSEPLDPTDRPDPPRPTVPQSVCDSCPICQAAATLNQVNPQVIADMTEVARSVITGLGAALSSAADQRIQPGGVVEPPDGDDGDAPGDVSGDPD